MDSWTWLFIYVCAGGQASSVSDAFSWHDLQGQGGEMFYENSATTTSTHDSCNALQNDMTASATGVDISRLLYSNVYSPGTFESLFAYENYNTPNRSVYDDKEARAVAYSGSDEVLLSNVNTGRFSSSAIQRDLINSISTNNHPISLHRRPYIGWIKLKAILKWCYLMKASRRRVHVQQLDWCLSSFLINVFLILFLEFKPRLKYLIATRKYALLCMLHQSWLLWILNGGVMCANASLSLISIPIPFLVI